MPVAPVSVCSSMEVEMELRVGFQIYALTLMIFLGWCLLAIFLPTGMQAFPFDFAA